MAFYPPLSTLQLSSTTFFFLTFLTLILILIMAILLRLRPWCPCHICQSLLTCRWSSQFRNLSDWYSHLLANSPTATIHIHVLRNVITANHTNVEYMLKTSFHNFPKGKPFAAILGDLLGHGIFNVDGELWKFQRKIASLELGSVAVRSFALDIVSAEIRSRLIPLISAGNGTLIDLQDVFRRFSFDTICKFSFGVDPCCLELSLPVTRFASAFDLASRLSAERAVTVSPVVWKLKRLLNIGSEKKLRDSIKVVHELADKVIKYKRKLRNQNHSSSTGASSENDLLSRFMSTTDDDVFLRDIVVSFLLAGRDSVASALTTFFWLISRNPQSIDSIRRESDAVLGDSNDERIPTVSELREMEYLHAAVHESLRLFPPVQFDSKFCQNDDVLPDGTFVGKGTRVTYHSYAMGRMDRIWGSDCLEFKPERWLRGGSFKMEDPFRYPVFHSGPRMCLGRDMALVEIKAVAVALIRRFDFRIANPDQTLQFLPGLTAAVRGGLPVVVQQRKR